MGRFLVTGIDVGHHSIKAVVLKATRKELSLVAYKEVPITENIFNDNHSINHQELVKKLKELKKELPLFSRHVAISLPDNAVISKALSIESDLEVRETEFAIYQAFAHQSPIPIEELCLDFVEVEDTASGRQSGLTYQVYATRKDVVEERRDAMKKVGFKPILLDMQAHSLLRIWKLACDNREIDENWALVDIGLTQTTVCIAPSDTHPFIKDIAFGTKNMKAAQEGGLTPGDVHKFCKELSVRLQKQIQLYNSVNPKRKLEGLWLSGGGSTLEGVCAEVGQLMALRCESLNPLELFKPKPALQAACSESSVYSCAAGLAVQGIEWVGENHGM